VRTPPAWPPAESAPLVEALHDKKLPWPSRTLVFLWGDEFRQSESWLDSTDMKPVAGISSDMTGQSKDTGAIALLERNYDPGALKVIEPDFHTPWGAGQVSPDEIKPNGLAVIARCAMADVSLLEGGTWKTAEHPFEGGSDHDKFLARGIPAVLFWHFTDFTYHTSLDRLELVDPESRRTGRVARHGARAADPGRRSRPLPALARSRAGCARGSQQASRPDVAELARGVRRATVARRVPRIPPSER
jgi:hypothetical protein